MERDPSIGPVLAVKIDELIEKMKEAHPEHFELMDGLRISMPFWFMQLFHEHFVNGISTYKHEFDPQRLQYKGIQIQPGYENRIVIYHFWTPDDLSTGLYYIDLNEIKIK